MLSTRRVRRAAVLSGLGALVAVQVVAGAAVVGAQSPGGGRIHPNQVFGALVNGENGAESPVEIQMACFGPLKPGETGHPIAGQTVTVFQPEAITGDFGNTGAHGHEIGAFFIAPPPGAGAAAGGPVIFHRYVTKKIPTSEVLPCAGTGQVYFVPLPMSPGSEKDVVIPVTYVGQP
ncbi:MAG: hypothetical protein ABSD78_08150 [Acidimicrobiales bacterium]|jgi:hypothetical protein